MIEKGTVEIRPCPLFALGILAYQSSQSIVYVTCLEIFALRPTASATLFTPTN